MHSYLCLRGAVSVPVAVPLSYPLEEGVCSYMPEFQLKLPVCDECGLTLCFVLNQYVASFDFLSVIVRLMWVSDMNISVYLLMLRFFCAALAVLSPYSLPSILVYPGTQGISISVLLLASPCALRTMYLVSHCLGRCIVYCSLAIAT